MMVFSRHISGKNGGAMHLIDLKLTKTIWKATEKICRDVHRSLWI